MGDASRSPRWPRVRAWRLEMAQPWSAALNVWRVPATSQWPVAQPLIVKDDSAIAVANDAESGSVAQHGRPTTFTQRYADHLSSCLQFFRFVKSQRNRVVDYD
jgi:hypothetical protein